MERREFLKIGAFSVLISTTTFKFANAEENEFMPVLIYDQSRCLDCKSCMAACQLEKNLPYNVVFFKIEKEEIGEYPKAKLITKQQNICAECYTKPCLKACEYNAISVKDGVILINEDKCDINCAENKKSCAKACPFDAIVFDKKAKKCDMCFDRIIQGDIPRCVSVCPGGALIYGNLKNPKGKLKELLENNPTLKYALYHHLVTYTDITPIYKETYGYYETKKPKADKIVNTVCLACNARCGLRIAVKDNKCIQIDGNPYHPYNKDFNQIPYSTDVEKSFKYSASTCAKPQMNNEYVYNPYRITKPLKRIGERGSGKFEPIEWDTLINEIAFGGKNFKHLGDETYYPGIKDILSDEPINKEAKELGPKRNQFVWFTGRSQGGRVDFIKRWVYNSIGSKNYIAHTDICGIGFRMGNYAFTDGKEVEMKADFQNCKYMLIFGANIYSALQPGVNTSGSIIAKRTANNDLKIVLIDPKAPKAVKVAHKWIPIIPTKDGALAMGIIRILIENNWYDKNFLRIPSLKEAKNKKRLTFSNATHLVIIDKKNKNYGKFLRGSDIGLKNDDFMVYENGKIIPSNNAKNPELEYEGKIKGIKIATAFKIMKNSVFEHSIDDYAKECGVNKEDIYKLAKEFWENAPYSAAFAYHGGGNYINGTYASYAISMLNALVGNVNRKGGYLGKGKKAADWKKGVYDLTKFAGMKKPQGVKISREKAKYEETTEFKKHGYPSKLPWYEFTKGGLSVAAMSGIDQKYPYNIKILFTYFSNVVYSMPGGYRFESTLKDKTKVPLFVSIDTTINETNIYADYIIPDVTYLEGHYGFLNPHAPGGHFTGVRTPIIEPLTKDNICLEKFLIDLSKKLKLPGYGEKVINNKFSLNTQEEYYLRGIYNLANNAKIPKADKNTIEYVEKNYLVAKYKHILQPEEWEKVCNVLAKGGVFKDNNWFDENDNYIFGFEKIHIYNERLANSTNTITGEKNFGTLKLIKTNNPFGFYLTSYKSALHTQSRTICLDKALYYEPDITLKINPFDAEKLGLKDNDKVKIVNEDGKSLITTIEITNFVAKGCCAYSHHFGHWQHGANTLFIKNAADVMLGNITKNDYVIPDKKRAMGICVNKISKLDKKFYDLPLVDPIGGIPDFSSTKIKIEKI